MADKGKVIKGLEDIQKHLDSGYSFAISWGSGLIRDALSLLPEQEPRVVPLDELTEIYVEFKGNACPVRLINFDLQKIIMCMDDGICRLWMGKPTDEQRQAVKWK